MTRLSNCFDSNWESRTNHESVNRSRYETDVALAIREGECDAGLAIEAVARDHGLYFVPLQWERFDLVVRRVEFFDPPIQRLLAFARKELFRDRAAALGGYDVTHTGTVVFNSRY